jgi:hypothetical protein
MRHRILQKTYHKILIAAGYKIEKCSRCGSTKSIVVHHKNKQHKDNALTNLEILCNSCHISHHHKGIPNYGVRGKKNPMCRKEVSDKVVATRIANGSYIVKPSVKKRISKTLKNNKKFLAMCKSPEWKEKVSRRTSEGLRAWYKKNGPMSQETKNKISLAKRGQVPWNKKSNN